MHDETKYRKCDACGSDILNKTEKCPNCEDKKWNESVLSWFGLVALLFFLIINYANEDGLLSFIRSDKEQVVQSNKTSQQRLSLKQKKFIDTVSNFALKHREAPNELHYPLLKNQRKIELEKILGGYTVESWVGTVIKIESNIGDKASLSIRISPEIELKTWNNSFSDLAYGTLIPQESQVYKEIFNLKSGQRVIFSGEFYPSENNYIREASLSTSGSMLNPEFIFKFTSVKKYD